MQAAPALDIAMNATHPTFPLLTLPVGTLLVAPGTTLPTGWRKSEAAISHGWSQITNSFNPFELERDLRADGWTLFFMASPVQAASIGWRRENIFSAAMARIIAGVSAKKCNCLEVEEIHNGHFLGMTRIEIVAHARHIQKGIVFEGSPYDQQLAGTRP